jgi:hypothetical protein
MIHYVCIATQNKLYLPYLKHLIPNLVVLGMNMKWDGYKMKFALLTEYLKTLDNNDIVCFLDAYDVLPTKNIVDLEKQFIKFSKKKPNVKMIVGGGKIPNRVQTLFNNIIFDNSSINSGTYIGYVKNIMSILLKILKQPNLYDDQIGLIKYSKKHKSHIYIDSKSKFFYVISTPLRQVNLSENTKCSFIHANGNGLMEDFLKEYHSIDISWKYRIFYFIEHLKNIYLKIIMYIKQYIFYNFITNFNYLII